MTFFIVEILWMNIIWIIVVLLLLLLRFLVCYRNPISRRRIWRLWRIFWHTTDTWFVLSRHQTHSVLLSCNCVSVQILTYEHLTPVDYETVNSAHRVMRLFTKNCLEIILVKQLTVSRSMHSVLIHWNYNM